MFLARAAPWVVGAALAGELIAHCAMVLASEAAVDQDRALGWALSAPEDG